MYILTFLLFSLIINKNIIYKLFVVPRINYLNNNNNNNNNNNIIMHGNKVKHDNISWEKTVNCENIINKYFHNMNLKITIIMI